MLCGRIHDRTHRRFVEAPPYGEGLTHAAKVEVARLGVDEAIRGQGRAACRIEDRGARPHSPACAARRYFAFVASVGVVERLLLGRRRDEVAGRSDTVGWR